MTEKPIKSEKPSSMNIKVRYNDQSIVEKLFEVIPEIDVETQNKIKSYVQFILETDFKKPADEKNQRSVFTLKANKMIIDTLKNNGCKVVVDPELCSVLMKQNKVDFIPVDLLPMRVISIPTRVEILPGMTHLNHKPRDRDYARNAAKVSLDRKAARNPSIKIVDELGEFEEAEQSFIVSEKSLEDIL